MTITNRLLPINYGTGRSMAVDQIVIHVTEGSAASVRSWFAAPEAKVSAHYMVCVDGSVDRFVKEEDTAWHAGRVDQPTAPLVLARPNLNPNSYSIGIEHEGTGTEELTPAQRISSLALIRDICARRGIPMDRNHIVGHHEVYSRKTCPGKIDVDALVAALSPAAFSFAPNVVWSPSLSDWLVVTRIVTDGEWYFVPFSAVRRMTMTQAGTPLSQMPTQP